MRAILVSHWGTQPTSRILSNTGPAQSKRTSRGSTPVLAAYVFLYFLYYIHVCIYIYIYTYLYIKWIKCIGFMIIYPHPDSLSAKKSYKWMIHNQKTAPEVVLCELVHEVTSNSSLPWLIFEDAYPTVPNHRRKNSHISIANCICPSVDRTVGSNQPATIDATNHIPKRKCPHTVIR